MSSGETKPAAAADATTTEAGGLLDKILESMPKTVKQEKGVDMIAGLIGQIMDDQITYDKNVMRTIDQRMDQIDAAISKQLAAIMHSPSFQKMEGSWRGLHHLVDRSETGEFLKLRVLNCSKRELFRDLDRAVEFDQSQLFKKIYETEYGILGGQPYGALIGDYEFTNHPEDVDLLTKVSGVAASAFCPFISAAAPQLMGFESYTELSRPRDLTKIFDSIEYTKWKSFRESEDSRFCVLTMPRVLSRLPYGAATKPVEEFKYEECESDARGRHLPLPHDHYAWMNAAYVMGARLTDAFARHAWCTAIRGVENGGKVEGLPAHIFTSDDGDPDLKCPTEIGITDRREKELSDLGFLPLCHYKNRDFSVFIGGQTCQRPKKYVDPSASANAEISARLPYIMAASRIAHYLKVIARDKIGGFLEEDECQDWLQRWISQYICLDDKPTDSVKAKYPLKEARIEVKAVPGKPGSYNAIAHLRPWLQFEELNASIRMVAELPKNAR
jgi:type VI secretion system protein ImpC